MSATIKFESLSGEERIKLIILAVYCAIICLIFYGIASLFDSNSSKISLNIVDIWKMVDTSDYSTFLSSIASIYEFIISTLKIVAITLFVTAIISDILYPLFYLYPLVVAGYHFFGFLSGLGSVFKNFGIIYGIISLVIFIVSVGGAAVGAYFIREYIENW